MTTFDGVGHEVTEEPPREAAARRSPSEGLGRQTRRSPRDREWDGFRRDVDAVCRTLERLVAALERL